MTSPTSTSTALRWNARLWGTLVVMCGAIFLDALDVSMVGVALPSIQSSLHLSTSTLQWVISGYVLGYGGLLLLGGRAADLLGRRRVFLLAVGAFGAASVLGALTGNGALLIATRFIKGMSAAFTAPAGLSIITTTFPEGPSRNRALSIFASCAATGYSLGLVLGGLLTELGWRWTFVLPLPVAVAIVVAASRLLPADRAVPRADRGYDVTGAITATGAMLLLVYAVVTAQTVGWGSPRTVGELAVVAALIVAFLVVERRTRHPLVRLGILRSAPLARANLAGMAVAGSYISFQFLGTLYLQAHLGWSPLHTALAFLPAGLMVAFGAPRTGRLADRYGTAPVLATGLGAFVVAYLLYLRAGDDPNYLAVILPTMVLLGAGFALAFPALNIQATAGVADHEQGLASGLLNTSVQVGGAIVLAVVTAVVSATGDGQPAAPADSIPALAVILGVAVAGLAVTLSGIRRPRPALSEPEDDAALEATAA
jgi:EmrB/QacA subfamily drug resistance transporter